ncbi:MAG: hypothetical protein AUH85_17420 [Chloroflexi bacterium 13_1_40CM_4_68_4]|nr:MAG: hypothetical protein AUH85_17420 [Chloroflexi bacterium 13_1_40CM_4_68_4]
MFDALSESRRRELEELSDRYGVPLTRVADLSGAPFNPVHPQYRTQAEVCLVVRRLSDTLLTAIKPFYPPGAYRLPTGGIESGESVLPALLRETREETGLEVTVERFLAAIAYRRAGQHVFETFAFLLDERGGVLASHDPHEPQDFHEITPGQLADVARNLESLPDRHEPQIKGSWRDWGRFRAIVHRVVHEALPH